MIQRGPLLPNGMNVMQSVGRHLINTGAPEQPGINGGLMVRRDPAQPCVNTVGVENLDASMAAVTSAGGTIVVPKMPVPTIGWLAYGKDPDGHIFGMMQNDPSAG